MSCYYPNGTPSPGDTPCSSGGAAACCPSGWKCESNGLCSLAAQGYYGRYTCTDKTWASDQCPQFCTQSKTAAGDEAVLQCSSGSYCCDANRPDAKDQNPPKPGCCDTSTDRFSLDALPIIVGTDKSGGNSSPSKPASSTIKSSTTTPSSTSTSRQTVQSTSSSSSTSILVSSSKSAAASSSFTSSTTTSSSNSISSQATPSTTSSTISPTSSQTAQSTSSSSTSVSVAISTITSTDGQRTLVTATSVPVQAPPSTTPIPPTPQSKPLGPIIGPAVAVPVAILGVVALMLFLFLRSRRSRREHPSPPLGSQQDPKPMYGGSKPPFPSNPELEGSPAMATFNKDTALYYDPSTTAQSPTTAPSSSRGSSGIYGTQQANRNSRGTGPMGNPAAAAFHTTPELQGDAVVRDMGVGARPPSELLGNTYRPYRPPGGGLQW